MGADFAGRDVLLRVRMPSWCGAVAGRGACVWSKHPPAGV